MRAAPLLAAFALMAAGCAEPVPEPSVADNQSANAYTLAGPAITLDFDGDGVSESVTEDAQLHEARFDNPMARAAGQPVAQKKGQTLLHIAGDKIGRWALGDAALEQKLPLRHGMVPVEFQACWNDPNNDALFLGSAEAAGVIAWKSGKFEWIKCDG